jgi:diacylglycerol kinase family enzyme
MRIQKSRSQLASSMVAVGIPHEPRVTTVVTSRRHVGLRQGPSLTGMLRLLLIANPSSSGFTGSLHRDVVATLQAEFEVTSIWPVNPAATRQQATDAADHGFDVVVAMGGDGVVHHVANGLVNRPTPLGIIPAGTTNVVARIHGMPRDPRAAAKALLSASPRPTTVAHITTDSESGARSEYAIFSAGVGFDADVVEIAERSPHSKLRFGSIHYARAAADRVLSAYKGRAPSITVKISDDEVRVVAVFLQIHHLYTYFGRIPIRLGRSGDQPPIALTIERLHPVLASRIVGKLATRRDITALRGVRHWSGVSTLLVDSDSAAPFQADGEHLGHARSIEVKRMGDALLVLAP